LVALLLLVWVAAATGAVVVAMRLETWARETVDARLRPHGFAATWQRFDASPLGHVSIGGLRITEGRDEVLRVASIEASLSWSRLLLGRLQLDTLRVGRPQATVAWMPGQAGAWQRLRAALRRKGDVDDKGRKRSLAERVRYIAMTDGELTLQVLGKPVWVLGTVLPVREASLRASSWTARTATSPESASPSRRARAMSPPRCCGRICRPASSCAGRMPAGSPRQGSVSVQSRWSTWPTAPPKSRTSRG
jgi:hypothetical protein